MVFRSEIVKGVGAFENRRRASIDHEPERHFLTLWLVVRPGV